MEIWKPVVGYEGTYEVSNLGQVRRVSFPCKIPLADIESIREDRRNGETYKSIAERYGVTKRAVISTLNYVPKRGHHRSPNRILKSFISSTTGYRTMRLCANGIPRGAALHRLVAEAFLGPIPKGMEVNHKNGIRHDARLDNLEIVTLSGNARHAIDILKRKHVGPKGEKSCNAKLTASDIPEIRKLHELGVPTKDISEKYGVCPSQIWMVFTRKSWAHVP